MFPLIAAAMSAKSGGQGSNPGGNDGMSNSIKYILIFVAIAVAAFFAWRAYKAYKDKKTATENNNIDTNLDAQTVIDYNQKKTGVNVSNSDLEKFYKSYSLMFANQLRSAFNPSGAKWLVSTDGTATKAVLAIAEKMKELKVPFSKVAGAYYTAYNDDLNVRLQKELNPKELASFYKTSGLQGLRLT